MPTHDYEQKTTFYQHLQRSECLDLRDNRGKKHDLAYILLGLVLGLLRKRDGKLSSIHRSMMNTNEALCKNLGISKQNVVSRAQLPRVLQKVNLSLFEQLLFAYFAIKLEKEEKQWFAGDGKELRGSIEQGAKRGEALVQLVRHNDRAVLAQQRYDGSKESEKPCLQELIAKSGAIKQKITADALHLCPAMTEPIAQVGGVFLIGLKNNQKELLADMRRHAACFKPVNEYITVDKGHGRLEKRHYFHYDISQEYFEQRWENSDFQSLFKVERTRLNLKTGHQSTETAYYLSNGLPKEHEYFTAIRNHWSVEISNHVRDVSLQEDHFRTKKRLSQVS